MYFWKNFDHEALTRQIHLGLVVALVITAVSSCPAIHQSEAASPQSAGYLGRLDAWYLDLPQGNSDARSRKIRCAPAKVLHTPLHPHYIRHVHTSHDAPLF
ncbi:hypothetical protein L798_14951 [Zootermopsis nevadensis]|uniref:Uncharacterized protein n=1 Tax=Zootermopsis nevadensis TaxID=136037 RepID=A0A067QPE6_ZOONE|nr:hypothetical protein L798_14951 [Zootermopsis nevadensis]